MKKRKQLTGHEKLKLLDACVNILTAREHPLKTRKGMNRTNKKHTKRDAIQCVLTYTENTLKKKNNVRK